MWKKIGYFISITIVLASIVAYYGYTTIFTDNTAFENEIVNIQIPANTSYTEVLSILRDQNVLKSEQSFDRVAGWMNYQRERVPSGSYELKKGWSNKEIISKLRAGIQKPKNVTFNNVRTIEELMGPLSSEIGLDSSELVAYFTDPTVLSNLGYTKENILSLFIPNSYQMYWDISLEGLSKKMISEHDKFWSKKNREQKAADKGLTKNEVYALASIVEKESQHGPERPIIAGLYLNRIKQGIALQADPTVVFANGDFGIRRVLNKHLIIDSPYNTYLYPGIPPGPIYMPSIESIDAVLEPEEHDYIFMCAKPGYGTQHAFAKTNRGHAANARKYHAWLSEQGIK
ncbi:MAG: endolytic transglycosylase MltG [Saprospiraceae bacterium]|nr:endolytic transglycosylase MltG [Saprospiraceae bacterium]